MCEAVGSMTSTAKQEEQEGFSGDSGSPTSTIHIPLKASYILYICFIFTVSFMILYFFAFLGYISQIKVM